MTKPRTERYLILSGIHNFVQLVARVIQPRYVIHNFVHQDARYDSRFRATSCTLQRQKSAVKKQGIFSPHFNWIQR